MPVHTIKPTQARVMLKMLESEDPAGQVPQDGARKTLLDIAHSLRTTSGSVKPGYLRLVQGDDGRLDFTLKRIGHNAQNDKFANLAKALIRSAYPDHHQEAEQAIEAYLQNHSGGKFGSQSFVKLIAQLESQQYGNDAPAREGSEEAEAQNLSAQVRTMRLKQDGFFSKAPRIDTSALAPDLLQQPDLSEPAGEFEVQVVNAEDMEVRQQTYVSSQDADEIPAQQQQPVDRGAHPLGHTLPSIKFLGLPKKELSALQAAGYLYGSELGEGGMGQAYTIQREDGQKFVYKRIKSDLRELLPLTLNRKLVVSGGYLTYLKSPSKNVPDFHLQESIAAPTHVMVASSAGKAPVLMSVEQARSELKKPVPGNGAHREMELIGELSILAPGHDLYQEGRRSAYPETQQKAMFSQLLEMTVANRQRGVVHRDLKGENIKFDPETQKVSVFDWDLAYKVSKKTTNPEDLPAHLLGSSKYMHPSTLGSKPCGFEADVHAVATIALENRYPNLMPSIQDAMAVRYMAVDNRPYVEVAYKALKRDAGLPQSFSSFTKNPPGPEEYVQDMKQLVFDLDKHAPQAIAKAERRGWLNEAQQWQLRLDDARRLIREAGWGPEGEGQAHPLVQAAVGLMQDAHLPAATWLDKNASNQMLQQRLEQLRAAP